MRALFEHARCFAGVLSHRLLRGIGDYGAGGLAGIGQPVTYFSAVPLQNRSGIMANDGPARA